MNDLSKYIHNGLQKINQICNSIDFQKTNIQFIKNQLPYLQNNFEKIEINKNVDENFFQFLKKNENKMKNLKIYVFESTEPITLKHLINNYFYTMNEKKKYEKMFYFYFNLVLMEDILKNNNKKLPRKDLKHKLKQFLQENCLQQKYELSKCISDNNIDIIPIDHFSNEINQKCNSQRKNFENCACQINKK